MKRYFILAIVALAASFSMAATPPKKATKTQKVTKVTAQDSLKLVTDSLNAIVKKADAGDADAQNTVGSWYYTGANKFAKDYKKALSYWSKAAKQGNAMAIGNMGICYQTGHGIKKDSLTAAGLFDKSLQKGNKALLEMHENEAKKGTVFSSMYAAHCYSSAVGVKKDAKKAALYYVMAAKQGSVDGMREAALALLNGNNATEAAKWFEQGAKHNDLSCTYWYGKLQLDGKGIKQDREKAIIYLMKAAEKGFPMADFQLGQCYNEGTGVEKNAEKAAEYYRKAAVKQNLNGKWALALALKDGKGTERNYDEAMYWFASTLKKGYARQFKKLCTEGEEGNWAASDFMTYMKGMKEYDNGNINDAMNSFKVLEKKKIAEASLMMTLCLLSDKNEKKNVKKGMKQLIAIAETSDKAKLCLAKIYEQGTKDTEKDMDKAMDLLKKAANNGYAPAQCYLGDIYFEGRGVGRDYKAASDLYIMAMKKGQMTSSASKRLTTCYESGWGVEKNTALAENIKAIDTEDNMAVLYKQF